MCVLSVPNGDSKTRKEDAVVVDGDLEKVKLNVDDEERDSDILPTLMDISFNLEKVFFLILFISISGTL